MKEQSRFDDSVGDQSSTDLNADKAGHGADEARTKRLLHEDITRSIIAAFYGAYDKLGFGFLESVYCNALEIELRRRGHRIRREVRIPVFYDDGSRIGSYRVDFEVDECVLLEVKSTEILSPSASRQLLNALCASIREVGLLLHFGPRPKFHRLIASRDRRRR